MDTKFYIVFGLAFVIFCVFTYLNTKTWRATHVIFSFLVFLAAFGYLAMATMTLKTHSFWMEQVAENEEQLEVLKEQNRDLAHGSPQVVDFSADNAFKAREALGRILIDRGRVWRGCQVNAQGGAIRVSTVSPQQAQLPEGPPPHRLQAKTVLHAFQEVQTPDGMMPGVYIGEFVVGDNPTETEMTLVPAIVFGMPQNLGGTWTLYEQMPVDGHEFFADLDEAQIRALLPNAVNLPPDVWEGVVGQFLRDGKRPAPEDAPVNIWTRLEFLRDYEIEVDSEAASAMLESTYFDNIGRAVVDRLRHGESAVVEEGAVVVFDRDTADMLIRDGVAKKDPNEPDVYVRPLNDYEFAFHNMYARNIALLDAIRVEQRDTATLTSANMESEQLIAARQTEQTNLKEDIQYLTQELNELTKLHDAMSQQWTDLRAELSRLYNTNLLMAKQLEEMDRETTEAIERRTAEALSAGAASGAE